MTMVGACANLSDIRDSCENLNVSGAVIAECGILNLC